MQKVWIIHRLHTTIQQHAWHGMDVCSLHKGVEFVLFLSKSACLSSHPCMRTPAFISIAQPTVPRGSFLLQITIDGVRVHVGCIYYILHRISPIWISESSRLLSCSVVVGLIHLVGSILTDNWLSVYQQIRALACACGGPELCFFWPTTHASQCMCERRYHFFLQKTDFVLTI
jgi:hypothetical protein